MEDLSLLFFGWVLEQTKQWQPIVGTPVEVPQPKTVTLKGDT